MPRTDGRETLGRTALCTLWKRDTASQPPETPLEQAKRPRAEAQGAREEEGERVLQQHSRASTWPRHSRTRFWHAEPVTLLGATATCRCNKGVRPLSQLRRCVLGAARCCVQDSSSFDGGGSRSMVPAQPHHVPLPSHALSLLAKTAAACNVVGAQLVPAHRPAGVRLIGPFLQVHVVSIAWQLAAAPRHCPRPQPSAFHLTLV